MIELPVDRKKFARVARQYQLRMLAPRRLWKGGWYITVWNSRRRRWEDSCDVHPDLDSGPFLKHEEKWATTQLSGYRALHPRRRFRLQPIGAPWILDFYCDLVWDPDAPERGEWFERWGGGSPLWRMLGRRPS